MGAWVWGFAGELSLVFERVEHAVWCHVTCRADTFRRTLELDWDQLAVSQPLNSAGQPTRRFQTDRLLGLGRDAGEQDAEEDQRDEFSLGGTLHPCLSRCVDDGQYDVISTKVDPLDL